jgi:hypothetical protein
MHDSIATHLLEDGYDIRTMQARVGHREVRSLLACDEPRGARGEEPDGSAVSGYARVSRHIHGRESRH